MEERAILDEQLAYYRARAPEYDEWFLRHGRYDLKALTHPNLAHLSVQAGTRVGYIILARLFDPNQRIKFRT
jgi:hypothetical protein